MANKSMPAPDLDGPEGEQHLTTIADLKAAATARLPSDVRGIVKQALILEWEG